MMFSSSKVCRFVFTILYFPTNVSHKVLNKGNARSKNATKNAAMGNFWQYFRTYMFCASVTL